MKKTRRIMLSLCAAVLLAAAVLSLLFVIGEADHRCSGEGCPVCEALCHALTTVTLTVPAAAELIRRRASHVRSARPATGCRRPATPVSDRDVILA